MQGESTLNIGIIGGGKMGKSLFNHLFKYPFNITWHNINKNDARKKFEKKLKRLLKHEIITQETYAKEVNRVTICDSINDLKNCHIISECINEDKSQKVALFNRLETATDETVIIVSNSSSISTDSLNVSDKLKKRMAGMHFFFPVETNKMVEIIPGALTEKKHIKTLIDFAEQIDKKVFLQNNITAFAVNRFFLEIQSGAFNYCKSNQISFKAFDEVVQDKLFRPAIFETMDSIGPSILLVAIDNYCRMCKKPEHKIALLEHLKKKSKTSHYSFLNDTSLPGKITASKKEEIASFVRDLFSNFANMYINKGFFNKSDIIFVLSEYIGTEFNPFDN